MFEVIFGALIGVLAAVQMYHQRKDEDPDWIDYWMVFALVVLLWIYIAVPLY